MSYRIALYLAGDRSHIDRPGDVSRYLAALATEDLDQ